MSFNKEVEGTLRATLAQLGVDVTVLTVAGTVARPTESGAMPLPTILPQASDLVRLRELGRGGMGVVNLAEQRSLGREVAIKMPLSSDPREIAALVREARIMGSLEHPNLVPLHSLGLDENGTPLIVMKRIDGVAWSELLGSPDHPAWEPLLVGHGDRLRAHVDILLHVGRALAFAHDRGIVHRDLKPSNVMIGRFGEIYLLDWGAALRLSERETEPPTFVGTPGYLAPEMVNGDAAAIDARTDVYLLGGTLYEVLTGRMPHDEKNVLQALLHAVSAEIPTLPVDAPSILGTLVESALAGDKQKRPPSAEAFCETLSRFLVSRDADIVLADARAAHRRGVRLLTHEGVPSTPAMWALVEARFGFASAYRMRPEDDSVALELNAVTARLIEAEIALRSPAAARALLDLLSRPPDALVSRVEDLKREILREKRLSVAMEQERREADISPMLRPFSTVLALTSLLMGVLGFAVAREALTSPDGFRVSEAIALDTFVFAVSLVGAFVARRALFRTVASRRLTALWLITCSGVYASDLITFALGHGTSDAAAHSVAILSMMIAVAAVVATRRVLIALPVALLALVAILLLPRFAPLFALGAIGSTVAVFVRVYRSYRSETGRDTSA